MSSFTWTAFRSVDKIGPVETNTFRALTGGPIHVVSDTGQLITPTLAMELDPKALASSGLGSLCTRHDDFKIVTPGPVNVSSEIFV